MSVYPQWFEIVEEMEKQNLIIAISQLSPGFWYIRNRQTDLVLQYRYEFMTLTAIMISMEKFDAKTYSAFIPVLNFPFCLFLNEESWITYAWSNHPQNMFAKFMELEKLRAKIKKVNNLRRMFYL